MLQIVVPGTNTIQRVFGELHPFLSRKTDTDFGELFCPFHDVLLDFIEANENSRTDPMTDSFRAQ